MGRSLFPLLLFVLVPEVVWAQADPPLMECYLPSITITHAEGARISFDLVLKKETGRVSQVEHQMYLLAYLQEDEEEILKTCSDPTLLNKEKQDDSQLFLDVLFERGLVTTLDTQVAKRQGVGAQDASGKYADGTKAGRSKESFLKLNTFEFSFAPKYVELFDKISKLKHFRNEDRPLGQHGHYKRKFKILVFVPVNDCKYASEVSQEIREKGDFGLNADRHETPILYCRPLPYEFSFRRDADVGTIVYIR